MLAEVFESAGIRSSGGRRPEKQKPLHDRRSCSDDPCATDSARRTLLIRRKRCQPLFMHPNLIGLLIAIVSCRSLRTEFLRYGVEKIVWRSGGEILQVHRETCCKSEWTCQERRGLLSRFMSQVNHFDIKQWHELNRSGRRLGAVLDTGASQPRPLHARRFRRHMRQRARGRLAGFAKTAAAPRRRNCSVVGNRGPHS